MNITTTVHTDAIPLGFVEIVRIDEGHAFWSSPTNTVYFASKTDNDWSFRPVQPETVSDIANTFSDFLCGYFR